MPIERRSLLPAAGAATLAFGILRHGVGTAEAAQPSNTPAQAPGFYRFRLGSKIVTMLNDGGGARPNPSQGFVRNAEGPAVEAALRAAFLPVDSMPIPYTIPSIEDAQGITLFDAGTGGQLGPTAGRMAANMQAAGMDPARVVRVVMTHFHGDHITGLTDADGKPLYPNAELVVPKAEWDFWMDDTQMSRAAEAMKPAFANVRKRVGPYRERLRQIDGAAQLATGIQAVPSYGHTPGHTSYLLSDGDDRLMVLGDVTNRPELNLANPGWHLVFDMDPTQAEASRREILDRAASERIACVGYHWPFPARGHVVKEGDGYRLVPSSWSATI
ncbi:MBL fold metallo-hydrolase [Pseudoroseomonas globiformis]|uniref:MBL fold metallo-hydrolase n=1 Tax=Teichococcus globiformis TaxID=2307229 RepID=A0ABV7G7V9_9PROT